MPIASGVFRPYGGIVNLMFRILATERCLHIALCMASLRPER